MGVQGPALVEPTSAVSGLDQTLVKPERTRFTIVGVLGNLKTGNKATRTNCQRRLIQSCSNTKKQSTFVAPTALVV